MIVVIARQLLLEAAGIRPALLDDRAYLERIVSEAIERTGATLDESSSHIHIYPADNALMLDVFLNGDAFDPNVAATYICERLKPQWTHSNVLRRHARSYANEPELVHG